MAKKKGMTKAKTARESAAADRSSAAGKRSGQGSKAARNAPSKAPAGNKRAPTKSAPTKSTTPAAKNGAGQKSKSTNGVAQRSQLAASTSLSKSANNKNEIDNVKREAIQRLIKVLKYWLKYKPDKFPFWARLKIGKNRTTLVIDEAEAYDKNKKCKVDGYVDREATHTPSKNTEEIKPNPDKDDPKPMNLKRPQKRPKALYKPHNKKLDMPEQLKKRYEGNNKKGTKK